MIRTMKLPFATDALASHISAETFEYHHGKHFKSYIKTCNELTDGTPVAALDLESIVNMAHKAGNTALFNAAGQVWNHGFFWASLTPPNAGRPMGKLGAAIDRDFGSVGAMAKAFVSAGTGQFGSGWVWLVSDADGALSIVTTPDAMPVWVSETVTPLLVCDVWEHAYYIDCRNDRGKFLTAFIDSLANWDLATAQYAAGNGVGDAAWTYPADPVPVTA